MTFVSTRGSAPPVSFREALLSGLAPDGGLYVPSGSPVLRSETWTSLRGQSLVAIGTAMLAPFLEAEIPADDLNALLEDALDFPTPVVQLDDRLSVLELFHGPTAAFKDVGARFLAAVLERILARSAEPDARPLTILVATSGDTGGAVAAAFHGRRGMRVGVFFPRGQVSPRQRHQLCCWGGNVRSFEVDGSFDDCQALVKAAFRDPALNARLRLTAANSINLGRLLPQVAYHAAAALWYFRRHGRRLSSIVPTGNLGNGVACVWARAMGMPIDRIVWFAPLSPAAGPGFPVFEQNRVYYNRYGATELPAGEYLVVGPRAITKIGAEIGVPEGDPSMMTIDPPSAQEFQLVNPANGNSFFNYGDFGYPRRLALDGGAPQVKPARTIIAAADPPTNWGPAGGGLQSLDETANLMAGVMGATPIPGVGLSVSEPLRRYGSSIRAPFK